MTIHGQIRQESDDTPPVAGVTVAIEQLLFVSPSITVASTTTDDSGFYRATFRATCGMIYVLRVGGGAYTLVRSSNGQPSPLPSEFCAGGDWPFDVWVVH